MHHGSFSGGYCCQREVKRRLKPSDAGTDRGGAKRAHVAVELLCPVIENVSCKPIPAGISSLSTTGFRNHFEGE